MLKIKIKIVRMIIASTIGSCYVIILYVTKNNIFSSIISKIILSIIIVYVTFNPQSAGKMWKQVLTFYLTSFVFGGISLYLIYFLKPQEILIKNGIYVGNYILKVILLGAILAVVIIKIFIKIVKTKPHSKDLYYTIKFRIEESEIETKAMLDTGNFVKEPITNAPVVIVESSLLEEVLPKEILNNLEEILSGDFKNVPKEIQEKYSLKLRCIPYKSLGKENGMLLGIKIKQIEIEKEDEKYILQNPIIGIYNKSFTKRGEYRALLGINAIE